MKLPRVSQIISPYTGYNKVPKKILEKACNRGTLLHSACLSMVKKEEFKIPTELAKYAFSFVQFLPRITNVISSETRFDDHEWGFTGMYDYVAEVNGFSGITVMDIKTSYASKKVWGCQLAAYARLVEKHLNVVPEHLIVVHLDRNGKSANIIEYDKEVHTEHFRSMCVMYHLFKPDDEEFIYD